MPSVRHLSLIERFVFCVWSVKSIRRTALLVPHAVPQAADHRTQPAFSFGALGRDKILGSEQGAVFKNIAPNCMWAVNSESKSPLLFTCCCVQTWVFKGTRACSLLVLGASALSDYYFSKQSHFFLQLGSLVKEMKMWICGMVPTYALKIWF